MLAHWFPPKWLQSPPERPGTVTGHLLQGGVEKVRSCLKFTQDMVSWGLDTHSLASNNVFPVTLPLTTVVNPCPELPVAPAL